MPAIAKTERLYVGVDVGGTKIQATLVRESGGIAARERVASPRTGGAPKVLAAIEQAIGALLAKGGLEPVDVAALGIAVPGVVDPATGRVVKTPNMSLTGTDVGPWLEDRLGLQVVLDNDCNLGTLGEAWLGAAREAKSSYGILVGTGIGGGFVRKSKLWRGHRRAAGEIGHMVMQLGGPPCGCGGKGCLESLASRSAIERDIRQAVADGQKTVLTDLLDGDLKIIRSGALKTALAQGDKVVMGVLRRASEVLGHACVAVYHVVDPQVIILGGGVVEACGDFMMPIVQEVVQTTRMPGVRDGSKVYLSALGDDAVVIGAAALARMAIGRSPFKKRYVRSPKYPQVQRGGEQEIAIGNKTYDHDIYIRVNGKVKRRKETHVKKLYGTAHRIGTEEVAKVCKGGPEILFIGTGRHNQKELTAEAENFLRRRAIEYQAMPTAEAIKAYNDCNRRKAALLHVMN